MSTTRRQRLNRIAAELENASSARRAELNRLERERAYTERTAAGIAPIEPAELAALFANDTARAWGELAAMTGAQLVNQAIEYAVWLEAQGKDVRWGAILDCWERKLAARVTEAVAEAGVAAEDITREPLTAGVFRWRGRTDTLPVRRADGIYAVPSSTKVGVTYTVTSGGCTCPGFRFRGRCRHVQAVPQRAA